MREKKEKKMSFAEELADNTKQAMVNALLRTVVSNPRRTIGDIQDALEKEVDAPYMPTLFRDVTIIQLVQAAAAHIRENGMPSEEGEGKKAAPSQTPAPAPGEKAPAETPPKKRKKKKPPKPAAPVEDSEEGDEGPEDDLEDEGVEEVRAPKKKKKKKKDKEKGTKPSGEDGRLSLVDPNDQKAYQSAIVKLLRKNKCVDLETGMSSTEIRKVLGGDPKQFRDNIDACVIAERVHKDGQARGVRYFIGK